MEASLPFFSVVGFLAVYRLTYLVVRDEGPFAVFEWFRGLFTGNNWMGRGVRCPYCVSFWMGLAVAPVVYYAALANPFAVIGLLGFGLSGAFILSLDLLRLSK